MNEENLAGALVVVLKHIGGAQNGFLTKVVSNIYLKAKDHPNGKLTIKFFKEVVEQIFGHFQDLSKQDQTHFYYLTLSNVLESAGDELFDTIIELKTNYLHILN